MDLQDPGLPSRALRLPVIIAAAFRRRGVHVRAIARIDAHIGKLLVFGTDVRVVVLGAIRELLRIEGTVVDEGTKGDSLTRAKLPGRAGSGATHWPVS